MTNPVSLAPLMHIPYVLTGARPSPRPRSLEQVARELQTLAGELWGRDEETANALLERATHLRAAQAALDGAEVHELEQLCAHCGHPRGEHLVDAPHGCEYLVVEACDLDCDDDHVAPCGCTGYLAPGAGFAQRDTERPPPQPAVG